MTVLYLSNCPPSLRGDLTKWLMEIATGVYVGRVSARVRDKLWQRVVETSKGGRAVLVFSTNNEQRMDFRIHGETWEPIDFDGLKLMLRPSPARIKEKQSKRSENNKTGFSNAAKFQQAKRFSKKSLKSEGDVVLKKTTENENFLMSYVVIDLETTGFGPSKAEIIEVGALKVINGEITDTFQSFIKIEKEVPEVIINLTGITNEDLAREGKELTDVMVSLCEFIEENPLIAHNMPFDISFLKVAFDKCCLARPVNKTIDTLALAKKMNDNLNSYKLEELVKHFELEMTEDDFEEKKYKLHRSLGDCYMTHLLYQKLMKMDG